MNLFGRQQAGPEKIQGVQISTAVNTLPTPIVYGTPRIGSNLIWLNGFTATPVSTTSGGGKGGKSAGSYRYNAYLIMALCEGPVVEPWIKYIDGTGYLFEATFHDHGITVSALEFADGDYAQVPNPQITSLFPGEDLAYRGVAYVYGPGYQLDASATVPQLHFVLSGFFTNTCPLYPSVITLHQNQPPFASLTVNIGFADASPPRCAYDLLTNPIYGAGFPGALIDPGLFSSASAEVPGVGDATWETYCQAIGIGFSAVLDSTESANAILQRWCELTNTAPVWTGTTLKFIPYGDTYIPAPNPGYQSPNPFNIGQRYYNPNVTPLFDLDDDDFEQSKNEKEDPVIVSRKDIADIYNVVRLAFKDRTNAWNDNVSEAKDENSIDLYGIRVDNLGTAREFSLSQYAAVSAQLRVQRNVAINRTFTFRFSWAYCILEPMDIITLTEPNIGLNRTPARIISIDEDERGILTVVAEIFPIGSAVAPLYPKQASTPATIYYTGVEPSPVNIPFIFEPTSAMLLAAGQSNPTVSLGVSGGISDTADPNWGGAFVYLSLDNVTYQPFGTVSQASRMGVTTANFPAYSSANPDNTNTLSIDLAESNGALETVTSVQAALALSLCGVINQSGIIELLSYTTATLTGANRYDLTGLYRGLYSTSGNQANSGAQFLRIDPTTFQQALPPQYIGQTLYIKLVSFNIVGQTFETLADATAYTFVPSGSGLPVAYFPVAGTLTGLPTSSQVIQNYIFGQTVNFPAGLVGSYGHASIGATATATFLVKKNGTNIGTMVFASGGSGGPQNATFTMATATTFSPGDMLVLVAPSSVDATLANLTWTFLGTTT